MRGAAQSQAASRVAPLERLWTFSLRLREKQLEKGKSYFFSLSLSLSLPLRRAPAQQVGARTMAAASSALMCNKLAEAAPRK